jgi:hypothetical protein
MSPAADLSAHKCFPDSRAVREEPIGMRPRGSPEETPGHQVMRPPSAGAKQWAERESGTAALYYILLVLQRNKQIRGGHNHATTPAASRPGRAPALPPNHMDCWRHWGLKSHVTLSQSCLVSMTYKSVGSTHGGRGKSGNKSSRGEAT